MYVLYVYLLRLSYVTTAEANETGAHIFLRRNLVKSFTKMSSPEFSNHHFMQINLTSKLIGVEPNFRDAKDSLFRCFTVDYFVFVLERYHLHKHTHALNRLGKS